MRIEVAPLYTTKLAIAHTSGAKSGALVPSGSVLVTLVEAWPTWPEAIKAAVRALVDTQRRDTL